MTWARNVDKTQAAIVSALEAIGCSVELTFRIGTGFPDLVVGYRHVTLLVECKRPGGKLEDSQVKFMERWRGSEVLVVSSPVDAVNGVLRMVKERGR